MTERPVARRHYAQANSSATWLVEPLEDRYLMAADAVLQWNTVLLDTVRAEGTSPPYAARNMAIVQSAVYGAVRRVDGDSDPSRGKQEPTRRDRANAEVAAVARAAHDTLAALYPDRQAVFDAALASSLADVPDGKAEQTGVAAGRKAARQVLRDRQDDGADATVPYTPGTGPDDWQPTPPGFAPALLPGWGEVTPFALKRGDQFQPPPPPKLTSAEFTKAFARVKSLGAATGSSRTPEQTEIALFWADGGGTVTPPGHWNQIAQELAVNRGNTLRENAQMFALLDVALADAGIASWDSKFAFNYCRPVTEIRNAAADGNPRTMADAAWSPLIDTPPFPSYVSGHSTFSAAAAAALAGFFGTDRLTFTTTSDAMPGVTRRFTSLWAAAQEAGLSRIYGGIHWDFDNTAGLATGRAVGQYAVKRLLGSGGGGGGGDDKGPPHGRSPANVANARPPAVFAGGSESIARHVWDAEPDPDA